MSRETIAIDFDGVLNSNTSGFHEGQITDLPVAGAVAWMWEMASKYDIFVFSCRALDEDGWYQIREWMDRHGFPRVPVTDKKPIASLYIDDRAFRFEGKFPTAEEMERQMTTWNDG